MNGKKPLDDNVWKDNLRNAINIINTSQSFLFSGDIDPDSVGSIYREQIDEVRKKHLNGKSEEVEVCKNCSFKDVYNWVK